MAGEKPQSPPYVASPPLQSPMGYPPAQGQPPVGYPPAAYTHAHPPAPGARGEWTYGLCDCCSPCGTCCLGYWCPCILYGKTQDRYKGDQNSNGINGSCCAFYALMCFGVPWVLQCLNRGTVRDRNGIEGGSCGDCCTSFWCGCCVLIQEDKEAVVRTTGMDPKTKQPYASPGQMTYP